MNNLCRISDQKLKKHLIAPGASHFSEPGAQHARRRCAVIQGMRGRAGISGERVFLEIRINANDYLTKDTESCRVAIAREGKSLPNPCAPLRRRRGLNKNWKDCKGGCVC